MIPLFYLFYKFFVPLRVLFSLKTAIVAMKMGEGEGEAENEDDDEDDDDDEDEDDDGNQIKILGWRCICLCEATSPWWKPNVSFSSERP